MRRITYGAACSLDGYIARPDGAVDWLKWSDDARRIAGEYWARVDTVLMGRKTYEFARTSGSVAYPGVTTYLFSRTLTTSPEPGAHLVREDAATFVADLKARDGGEICLLGGGELATTLIRAGLVDEVGVNLHPILLGDGIPLIHRVSRSLDLELVRFEPIAHGCLYALYRVRG